MECDGEAAETGCVSTKEGFLTAEREVGFGFLQSAGGSLVGGVFWGGEDKCYVEAGFGVEFE